MCQIANPIVTTYLKKINVPERGQRQTFFDPLPHLVHLVIAWPPEQFFGNVLRYK